MCLMSDKHLILSIKGSEGKSADEIASILRSAADGIARHISQSPVITVSPIQARLRAAFFDTGDLTVLRIAHRRQRNRVPL
jgi:hypothetical protein